MFIEHFWLEFTWRPRSEILSLTSRDTLYINKNQNGRKKYHVTLEKPVGIKQLNCYYSGKSLTPCAVKSVGFDHKFFETSHKRCFINKTDKKRLKTSNVSRQMSCKEDLTIYNLNMLFF